MTDEEFKGLLRKMEAAGSRYSALVVSLRSYDTAQREALARVEAERDEAREFMRINAKSGLHYAEQRDALKAQLAEAVGLLRNIEYAQKYGWEDSDTEALQAFLARHAQAHSDGPEFGDGPEFEGWAERSGVAQAEQQEAEEYCHACAHRGDNGVCTKDDGPKSQGAQAGDERAAFEEWYARKITAAGWSVSKQGAWWAWQARAALATRSTEYPAGAIENGRVLMSRLEQWYTFADDQGHALTMCKEWLDLKECFGHMADALATQPAAGEPVAKYRERSNHDVIRREQSQPCYCWANSDHRIGEEVAAPPAAAHGDEAARVLELLATCEWKLIKSIPADYLTDESNARNAWWVERQQAPYCSESGERVWTGSTPIEAFEKAIAAMRAQAGEGEDHA